MALGFAAFIRFMKVKQQPNGSFTGLLNGTEYTITDSQAEYFSKLWESSDAVNATTAILGNTELWDADLSVLPGFKSAVIANLNKIMAGNITEPVGV